MLKMTLFSLTLTLTLILAQASISQAATQSLLRIGNDRDHMTSELGIQTDANGTIQKFIYVTAVGQKTFSAAQIAKGAVLEAEQGVNALTLLGNVSTGRLAIKYVYNGLSGDFRTCNMNLTRSPKGDWAMVNAYTGKALLSAKLITWGLGIETLKGLCEK